MISALPIWVISKEISRSFHALAAMNYLMEDGHSEKENIFQKQFNNAKHQFIGLFFEEK